MYPNLEAELKRYGYSRTDVAKALGVCVSTASAKLSGSRKIQLREAKKLRDELFPRLQIDYLFDFNANSVRRDA